MMMAQSNPFGNPPEGHYWRFRCEDWSYSIFVLELRKVPRFSFLKGRLIEDIFFSPNEVSLTQAGRAVLAKAEEKLATISAAESADKFLGNYYHHIEEQL